MGIFGVKRPFEEWLFQHFCPAEELLHAFVSELLEALCCLVDSEDAVGTGLGVELVGIADDDFLDADGLIVGGRQGQVLTFYLFDGDACTSMTFADTSVPLVTLLPQQLCSDESVTDVWLRALAEDGGGMTPAYADVVEHSGFLEEGSVGVQLRMLAGEEQTAVGHLP